MADEQLQGFDDVGDVSAARQSATRAATSYLDPKVQAERAQQADVDITRETQSFQREIAPVMERATSAQQARSAPTAPKFERAPEFQPKTVTPKEWMSFTGLITGLAVVFGAGAGARGAMAALSGAMQGFHSGNLEQAKAARDD